MRLAACVLALGACGRPSLDLLPDVGAPCSSPVASDPRAAEREACSFGAGAMPLDTIGITADDRHALPIDHVVVVMKENRSFDEYFGRLSRRRPDVEPVPPSFSNVDADGNVVTPFHETTTCSTMDPDHSWAGLHAAVNGGKMDGFVKVSGVAAMAWYDETDLPFYDFLADRYALADRYFSSVLGPTFPNRHYLLLGTSTGIDCTGCAYPPVGTPSLLDELDAKGVAWGAYSEDGDPFEGVLGLEWRASHAPHLHAVEEFFAALRTGDVPSVSFVDSRQEIRDDHPRSDIQVGEAWTRDVYEATVASPIWRSTALFWVFDEGGGFADHVPPPTSCVAAPSEAAFFELGVRVPMVVVSPYARRRYVSHLVHEHTSITRFVETLFDLPALTARDANSDALLDMFDFACPPDLAPPPAPRAGTGGCR